MAEEGNTTSTSPSKEQEEEEEEEEWQVVLSEFKDEPRDSEANRRRQNRLILTEEWIISTRYETKGSYRYNNYLYQRNIENESWSLAHNISMSGHINGKLLLSDPYH